MGLRIMDDKTKTPLTWTALIAAAAVSITFYISRVEGKAQIAEEKASLVSGELEDTRKEMTRYLQSIDQRLSRMEGSLQRRGFR
jgi:hypothetical protein